MAPEPDILLVAGEQEVVAIFRDALHGMASLTCLEKVAEVSQCLAERKHHLLFCAWSFCDGQWKDVLAVARRIYPELPIVVLSRTACEQEWVEVLEMGAFDLVDPPYGKLKLLAVMEQALESYQARLERKKAAKCGMLRAS